MRNLDNTFATTEKSNIILFVNEAQGDDIQDRIKTLILEYLAMYEIVIGFSLGFTKPGLLATCFHQAFASTRYTWIPNNREKVYFYSDVAVYDMLNQFGDKETLLAACHPAAILIYNYKNEKGKKLIPVVKAYIECVGNTEVVSKRMNLHRNTVYYRLKRAESITGLNFSDGNPHLHLLIFLYAIEFINQEGLKNSTKPSA